MYKFLLKPKWLLLHITIISAVVATLNLASWQLRRHDERDAFNKTVRASISAPVVDLATIINELEIEPQRFEWRRISIAGTYLDEETIVAVNKSQDGYSGKDPLTPLDVIVNNEHKIILVNRGFIALDQPVPVSPLGNVQVTGRLRVSQVHRAGQLSDQSRGVLTEVINIDLPRLSQQIENLETKYYVEVLASSPSDSPIVAQIAPPVLSAGPHLGYVAQWIMIAGFTITGWVIVIRRKIVQQKTIIK